MPIRQIESGRELRILPLLFYHLQILCSATSKPFCRLTLTLSQFTHILTKYKYLTPSLRLSMVLSHSILIPLSLCLFVSQRYWLTFHLEQSERFKEYWPTYQLERSERLRSLGQLTNSSEGRGEGVLVNQRPRAKREALEALMNLPPRAKREAK